MFSSNHQHHRAPTAGPGAAAAFLADNVLKDRIQAMLRQSDLHGSDGDGDETPFEALDLIKRTSPTASKRLKLTTTDQQQLNGGLDLSGSDRKTVAGTFPCSQCHKTFSAEVDLKAHLQRHITQHPFVCLACGKGFKYEHSLNFHIKSYHGSSSNGTTSTSPAAEPPNGSSPLANSINGGASSGRSAATKKALASRLTATKRGYSGNGYDDPYGDDGTLPSEEELYEDSNNNGRKVDSPTGPAATADMGCPANLGKGIQIKSEKGLITIIEGIHSQSDQPYLLYKCCLCGFAFPSLEPMLTHVQSLHQSAQSNLTCDKCGATFKWRSELQLHEHIHTAMEQQHQMGHAQKSTTGHQPLAPLLPSFLQPNLALLGPYLSEHFGAKLNGSLGGLNGTANKTLNGGGKNGSMLDIFTDNSRLNISSLNLDLAAGFTKTSTGSNGTTVSSKGSISNKDDSLTNRIKDELLRQEPSANKQSKTARPSNGRALADDDALSLLKDNPFRPKLSSTLGEIEETSPGQFKCRFCDKTFDRIFSVHRHERVHTGYKPCICKVCGRGFSEKRNLRHHIIRFHSDGSGRELLKRARKDKTLAATTKELASKVLKEAALKYLSSGNEGPADDQLHEPEIKIEIDEVETTNDDEQTGAEVLSDGEAGSYTQQPRAKTNNNQNQNDNNSSDGNIQAMLKTSSGPLSVLESSSSSSRRRKSKPSKKSVEHENEALDEDDEDGGIDGDRLMVDDNDDDQQADDGRREESESKSDDQESSLLAAAPSEATDEDDENNDIAKASLLRRAPDNNHDHENGGEGELSSDHSQNSIESAALGKLKNRGSFSSYSPRLDIVEKPIRRTEACRPLLVDGKSVYPCGYCSKSFCSHSDLNRHLNFHEDVRPFKCEHCNYQSRTNAQLNVHKLRHAGIKNYLCSTCNYNGVTQSDLNRHCKTRAHLLRSANVCPLCSLGFSTRNLLEEHLNKLHNSSIL